jgi:hypothetical protein
MLLELGALLEDLSQLHDEIVRDAVIAEMGNDVHLERRDQGLIKVFFILLLREGHAIYGRTYPHMEVEQRDKGTHPAAKWMHQSARMPPW